MHGPLSFPRANTALMGWDCWDGSAGEMEMGLEITDPLVAAQGRGVPAWMGVPKPRRAQSQRVAPAGIQARLETEGVWRVPEVEGAAGKSRSRKFCVLCTELHPLWHHLTKPSDVPTQIQHPPSSSRGKLGWKDPLGRRGPSVPKVLQGSLAPMASVGFLVQS